MELFQKAGESLCAPGAFLGLVVGIILTAQAETHEMLASWGFIIVDYKAFVLACSVVGALVGFVCMKITTWLESS